jgi:hypothetical protein
MLRKNYAVIFYVLILMFALYSIFKAYGFTYFPDEFGYWMYAAKAAGYDWTNIASIGSYYSYGYSIILFPIFSLFKNAVTAYRVAVAMNFVLIGIAYFLLLRLGKDLEIKAAVALCYPPLLFYAKSTMVEVLLAVMFIVICALLYSYIDKGKSYTLVGIILGLVYIHFVHMRAVGVLLAGILTLIIYFALEKKKIGKLLLPLWVQR